MLCHNKPRFGGATETPKRITKTTTTTMTIAIHQRHQSQSSSSSPPSLHIEWLGFNYVRRTHTPRHTPQHTYTHPHPHTECARQTFAMLDVDIASRLEGPRKIYFARRSLSSRIASSGRREWGSGRMPRLATSPIAYVWQVIYLTDTFFCVDCIVIPT